jgi:micrococcal nuclease
VIDGDTIRVKKTGGPSYTIRLIGIDTPETQRPGVDVECGGREATGNMLALSFTAPIDTNADTILDAPGGTGARVKVRTDRSQDLRDRFGRYLAYVTVIAGEPPSQSAPYDLGLQQIRAGAGQVYIYRGGDFSRVHGYENAENGAIDRGLGAWVACGGDFHRPA